MYACIDLGSNSFHLLIAEWNQGRIELIERCSEKVQLGEGVPLTRQISPAAFNRGIECLSYFRSLIEKHGVKQYWALGTNTFRIAKNADEFLQAAAKIGIDIAVISGVQEAVLIYAGVICALEDTPDQRLVIDIGGGSTELIIGREHERLITHSLPIGSISWRDKFFAGKKTDVATLSMLLDRATEAAITVFKKVAPSVTHFQWTDAYGSSGTAKMLAMVCKESGHGDGIINLELLRRLRPRLIEAISSGKEVAGLKEKRRELLLPGLAVMSGLMESFNCPLIFF